MESENVYNNNIGPFIALGLFELIPTIVPLGKLRPLQITNDGRLVITIA